MFPKIDFNSSRIDIFYRNSKDYILDRPNYLLYLNFKDSKFFNYNHYITYVDGKLGRTYKLNRIDLEMLEYIYRNVINYILINHKLTFHSLKKEFNVWKRYSSFKKYQKSLLFFEDQFKLPKSIINKIAWYCV